MPASNLDQQKREAGLYLAMVLSDLITQEHLDPDDVGWGHPYMLEHLAADLRVMGCEAAAKQVEVWDENLSRL